MPWQLKGPSPRCTKAANFALHSQTSGSRPRPALTATALDLPQGVDVAQGALSAAQPSAECAQDLSPLRFDAYDADFNRSLAAAQTIGNLDEVLPLPHAKYPVKRHSFRIMLIPPTACCVWCQMAGQPNYQMGTHDCTGAQFDCCVLWPQLDDAKGAVKVLYHSQKEYERITGRLRMLREWKVRHRLLLI